MASILFFIIQLLSEVLLTYALIASGMIPTRFIILAILVEIVLLVVSWVLAFKDGKPKSKHQKNSKSPRRTIAAVLALLIFFVSLFAYVAVEKFGDTLSEITSKKSSATVIGVYVLSDDPAENLNDAKDYNFGYTTAFDKKNTLKAIDGIKDELGSKPKTTVFDDVNQLVKALYDGEVDAIILNESYSSIISDQDGFSGFKSDTKIIYEYKIKSSNDKVKRNGNLNTFVFYLSGSDTTDETLSGGRSDVNILMAVNTKTKEILLVNTPRDYYVPISVSDYSQRDKLTHCGIYGTDCSMDTLGHLYGTDIDYFARINFTGFATLIDAIGGITVYADEAFHNSHDNPLLDGTELVIEKGENHLNGAQALGFARERMNVARGDDARGINQMKMITAVIDKMSAGTILLNYSDILDSLEGMFETDMSSDEITKLVKMQLNDMASWNIHSYAVSGTGSMGITYSMPGTELYITKPDQATIDHAAQLIDRVLSGKTISDDDVK